MGTLRQAVQDLLFSIFSNNPEEADRRRALRKLHQDLSGINPAYIERGGEQVLPGFATVVYNFTLALQPVCQILRQTLDNDNPKLGDRFRDALVEGHLPEPLRDRRTSFSYDSMVERLASFASLDDEIRKLDRDFDAFTKQLATPALASFDAKFTQLEQLAALCRHNFVRLLALFDPAIKTITADTRANFQGVQASKAENELLDIYFLLSGLDMSQGVEVNMSLLLDRLGSAGSIESKDKVKRAVTRLDRMLKRQLSPLALVNLIRASRKDPYFVPESDREMKVYLASYRDRVKRQYQRDRDRIIRERRENSVTREIKGLFNEAELLALRGYDEETARTLHEDGYSTFSHVRGLQVLKSFTALRFEQAMKERVNKLMVEGYFEDKSYLTSLSNLFYGCSGILESISGFEDSLVDGGRVSVAAIHRYREKPSKQTAAALNKLVDQINGRANKLIEEGTNLFYNLTNMLLDVINDYKQQAPVHVTNIKVISGTGNREFIGALVQEYNESIKFIRVMKNFTVLRAQAQTQGNAAAGAPAADRALA